MTGEMVHIEMSADDTGAAMAFWGGLLGVQFQAFPEGSEYHMARINDSSGIAVSGMEPGRRGARTYFDVADINASVAQVGTLGGESSNPIPVKGMGWFATCSDPSGNEFGLWQSDTSAPGMPT